MVSGQYVSMYVYVYVCMYAPNGNKTSARVIVQTKRYGIGLVCKYVYMYVCTYAPNGNKTSARVIVQTKRYGFGLVCIPMYVDMYAPQASPSWKSSAPRRGTEPPEIQKG